MIDQNREEILSLADAAAYIARKFGGRKPSTNTMYRWCIHGLAGVVLESLKRGQERKTSKEAIHRFFQRRADTRAVKPAVSTPTRIASPESLAAEQYLIAEGV